MASALCRVANQSARPHSRTFFPEIAGALLSGKAAQAVYRSEISPVWDKDNLKAIKWSFPSTKYSAQCFLNPPNRETQESEEAAKIMRLFHALRIGAGGACGLGTLYFAGKAIGSLKEPERE